MGLDLILYWKRQNYRKVILLNLKMSLCAWWPIFFCFHKRYFIQNLFQKLNSEIWDFQWQNFECNSNTSFYRLDLAASFQIIKIGQCCGFTFTNFFCFLTATNALMTSWVTFSNTSVFFVFFLFSDLIFPW